MGRGGSVFGYIAAIPRSPMPSFPRAKVPFDLTGLHVFIATAEIGDVTKAAQRLALAAGSRRILDPESQFGVTLSERRPHGMALTEAGRTHARGIVHTVAWRNLRVTKLPVASGR